jgi:hypothetical protein
LKGIDDIRIKGTIEMKSSLLLIGLIGLFGCKSDGVCEDSDFLMTNFFQELLEGGFTDKETLDTDHSYTFVLSEDKILCAIGYESQKNVVDYRIELKNQNDSILFNEIMSFNHKRIEYKSVGNILLSSKDTFTITRKVNSGANSASDHIGRVAHRDNSDSISFPITKGQLTVIDVNFDSIRGINFAIPLLDLEVKH